MNEREQNLVEPAALVVEEAAADRVAEHGALRDASSTADPAAPSDAPEGTGVRIRVESFEGPLDLLLFLIKRDEIDVTDIPIAHITAQYLDSIQDVDALDLDRAGEYLLMAATLMRIKAKMLLPVDLDEESEEEIDPRQELVRRLLEYKEFKRVGEVLAAREEEWRGIFARVAVELPESNGDEGEGIGANLVDLFRAFRRVLESTPGADRFDLVSEVYTVDERIEVLRRECFVHRDGVSFSSIFPERRSRALVITTFLALLEMIRRGEIEALQADSFGEIWLKQKEVVAQHES